METVDLLKRKLEKEKKARYQAEKVLEIKTNELYSANQKLEELHSDREALLEGVSKALTTIFRHKNLDEALQKSLDKLGPKTKADRISIFLREASSKEKSDKYFEWSGTTERNLHDQLKENEGLYSRILSNTERYFKSSQDYYEIGKKSDKSHESTLIEEAGMMSGIYFPILVSGDIQGILGLEFISDMHSWTGSECSMLRAFSAGIGSVIEKKSTQIAIEEQKQFYESVLNSIPSDLVVFNTNHTYRFINPQAIQNEKIRSWLTGKDDYDYVKYRGKDVAVADKRRKTFRKVIESKQSISFEEKIKNREGETRWKHRIMYPVLDNEGNEIQMVIGYAVDTTDIKNAQKEIENTSERLETLIASLKSGVLLEDKDRKILVTNDEFCQIFGIPAEPKNLVGVDCSDSAEQSKHLAANPEQFVERIDQILHNREVVTNEEIVMKDGRVYERDFIPIYHKEEYLGHLWEYRNITEKKQAERQLIQAKEEAVASQKLKQKFLANMSHEVRTPMNGVIGIVHLLEKTELDENQQKYLNILRSSSEHLLRIINDILDVSKIEEGKLVLKESPIKVDNVIDGVIQNVGSRAKDKKLGLEVSGLDVFGDHLIADPVRLRQVLLNLLSNAIKFTHKGKISLICKTKQETSQHHTFSIEIRDTGIGIERKRLGMIFEAFNQAEENTSTQYGGTGLGLNIVKELVHKMGGEVDVKSKIGIGTSFTITLKLEKAEEHELQLAEKVTELSDREKLTGKRILVADDHYVNLMIANEILKDCGAVTHYAKDGAEAVNMLLENMFDLILMDMQMPNVDGIEATKMIRSLDKPKSDIPIIAMTAAALPEEREKCLQSGMNDYISKPVNPQVLFDILTNYLSDETDYESHSADKPQAGKDVKLYDLSYLRELSGNNTSFILEMIDSFINDMPKLVEDLFKALKEEDYASIEEIAHKSKSSAGYVGCEELRKRSAALELKAEEKVNFELFDDIHAISILVEKIIVQLKNDDFE